MLNIKNFADCIRENLKDRKYGKEKADEIIKDFENRAKAHINLGGRSEIDASLMAMKDVFDSITEDALQKAKRTSKMLSVQAEGKARLEQAGKVDVSAFTMKDLKGEQVGPRGSRAKAIAHAVMSTISQDKRFSGVAYETKRDVIARQFFALFGDALEPVRKGVQAFQHGKAHLPNIVHQIFGKDTGDVAAKELAHGVEKIFDLTPDLFNAAGGSMRKLKNYFPNPATNIAKILKNGEEQFVKMHTDGIDWTRTVWPDGKQILPAEREDFLREVYQTKATDGANKIDDTKFRGQGRAVGNLLDQDRILHYKDSDTWLKMHDTYGDGTVLDTITHHIHKMSHLIAAVDTFGPNPDLAFTNLESMARKKAVDMKLTGAENEELKSILHNKVRPMFEISMRKNPMNSNGLIATTATTLGNMLSAAYLGGSAIPAFFGDFATTFLMRGFNKMPVFDGIGVYIKTMAGDNAFQRTIANRSGWIHEQSVMSLHGVERFNPLSTMGPALSRRLADGVLRASGNTMHTTSLRWTIQSEFMGFLNDLKAVAFKDVPIAPVMERYGITEKDWDAFRNGVKTWSPREDVTFLRPIDILETDLANKQDLYRKFQGMILSEAQTGVPASTLEARVSLKGDTRPDTLSGFILHSFGTFKNFPMSYANIIGRMGMTTKTASGRLGFYAATAVATTIAGAMAYQMRELAKGRTPVPMWDEKGKPNLAFFGKAFLFGGGAGIWGDFLFAGVNQFGQGPQDVAAGPLIDIAGDLTKLTFGGTMDLIEGHKSLPDFARDKLKNLVSLTRKLQPGGNLWHAQLLFQRDFWDIMENIADPQAAQKRRTKESQQQKNYGNKYWWHLGKQAPEGSR